MKLMTNSIYINFSSDYDSDSGDDIFFICFLRCEVDFKLNEIIQNNEFAILASWWRVTRENDYFKCGLFMDYLCLNLHTTGLNASNNQ